MAVDTVAAMIVSPRLAKYKVIAMLVIVMNAVIKIEYPLKCTFFFISDVFELDEQM